MRYTTRSYHILLLAIALALFFVPQNSFAQEEPRVTTLSARDKTFNSARIRGRIDPKDVTPTSYWFEWGTTDDLGRVTGRITEPRLDRFEAVQVLTNLNPDTKYYFRLVGETPGGRDEGSIRSFTTDEFEDFFELDRDPQCDDDFDNDRDGRTDYPQDPGCESRNDDSELTNFGFVSVSPQHPGPTVFTVPATVINQTTAVLNAQVNLGSSAGTQVWFEWSTNPSSLDLRTPIRNRGEVATFDFSETLTSLLRNTTYYYRPVAKNIYGIAHGTIQSFTTNTPTPVVTTVSIPSQPTSAVPTAAPQPSAPPISRAAFPPTSTNQQVLLQKRVTNINAPNGTNEAISAAVGDVIHTSISLVNTSSQARTDIIVKDILSETLSFIEGSEGSIFSTANRSISWLVPFLPAQETVTVSFTARVNPIGANTLIGGPALARRNGVEIVSNDAFIIMNTVPFAIARNQNENTVAPSSDREPENTEAVQAAQALGAFGGGILPTTFMGWVIFALLLLAILFLIRYIYATLYKRRKEDEDLFDDSDILPPENVEITPTLIRPPGR